MVAGRPAARWRFRSDRFETRGDRKLESSTSGPIPRARRPQTVLVYLIAMVAAVGGFLFGYDLQIISGAKLFLEKEFSLGPYGVGIAMASALLGCMAGPLLGGTLGDRWGRKRTLIFSGLLFAAGSIGSALPANILEFDLFRFLGGVGVGLASVVSPMFIAEVSPPRIRGRW